MDGFSTCFKNADQLIITKLYSANQSEIKNVNSNVLTKNIKKSGFDNVIYIDDLNNIVGHLNETIRVGDAVVFLSAGNLTDTDHAFARIMEERSK